MGRFFSTSDAGALALHSMVMIANRPDRLIRIRDIAAVFGFSEAHLAKVLGRLVKSGLINATRGPSGGYQLAKPSESISVADIYRAIEGDPSPHSCMFRIPRCNGKNCALGDFFSGLSRQVEETLEQTKLSEVRYAKMFEHLIKTIN